jgi:hypothetical protein
MNDLFNNPMVSHARKAMTPEQLENYKKIGEYMYNTDVYKVGTIGSKIKDAGEIDLLMYAKEALKAGADPKDLTDAEIQALISFYGDKWYEQFGLLEEDIRKPIIQKSTKEDILNEIERKVKETNLSRQQRRFLERKLAKERAILVKECAKERVKERRKNSS